MWSLFFHRCVDCAAEWRKVLTVLLLQTEVSLKNILIACNSFAPDNSIGAIRPTKLAKYLDLAGYNVTVITEQKKSDVVDPVLSKDALGLDVHYIKPFRGYSLMHKMYIKQRVWQTAIISNADDEKKQATNDGILSSLLNYFFRFITSIGYRILDYNQRFLAKRAMKLFSNRHFDVVITSYPEDFSLYFGMSYKSKYSQILWIADFRDPIKRIINNTVKSEERAVDDTRERVKMISKVADIIIGVSESCIKDFEEICFHKCHIICNGFDRNDLENIIVYSNEKFTLTYTGHLISDKLYKGKQDLSSVFKAINSLIEEKRIDGNKLLINYAGKTESLFKQQVTRYHLQKSAKIHGFIDRHKSLSLQRNSTILLLASWNYSDFKGVLTGKFLEYLMIDKPIICTVVGNDANSKLKEMITEANNGVVWEEANNDVDYPILKSYILEQYERFVKGKQLLFKPNREYIEQYNYKFITQQYINLIEEHFLKSKI